MDLHCKFCGAILETTFANLGMTPLVSSYLAFDELFKMEPTYPLHVYVCNQCFLVQLPEAVSPEAIFREYPYFSSYSDSWLRHAQQYTELMIERFGYDSSSQILEIASNDGYLLQFFKQKGISVLGVEPAKNVAAVAIAKGIPTVDKFFGVQAAENLRMEGKAADLLIGNNVLAHVPNINDFVEGLKILLARQGVITMEFPHLLRLIDEVQFDTIFHEHFSYLSLFTIIKVFEKFELVIFDVEELSTHGGSLRIYAKHQDDDSKSILSTVDYLVKIEIQSGLRNLSSYSEFMKKVYQTKFKLLSFLINAKLEGYSIAGYGAPGKGVVLLNYCGIRSDILDFTVDRSPYKQGYFMPGVHVPIYHPDAIKEFKPDYLLILPWNLKHEIMGQMSFIREWGGQFIVPIPEPKIYS